MKQDASAKTHDVVTDDVVRKIAEDASADERSVWKRLAGGRLRPKTQRRVDDAIEANLGRAR